MLPFRQLFTTVCFALISVIGFGQEDTTSRIPIGFGFHVGVNHSLLSAQTVGELPAGEGLRTENKPGFSLGLVAQLDFGRNIRIRPGAGMSFINPALVYQFADGQESRMDLSNVYLDFPLHFQFAHQSLTQNISILFGVRHSRAMGDVIEPTLGLRDRMNTFEVGLGKEFELPYFSISPEILYGFGMDNLFRFSTRPELDGTLDQLFLDRVQFRLVFTGK